MEAILKQLQAEVKAARSQAAKYETLVEQAQEAEDEAAEEKAQDKADSWSDYADNLDGQIEELKELLASRPKAA